ncbi:MAG: glycosyltransferase family 4 protein [Methylobacter sp.]|nr:glycosyltransferase family 4 protein [Methylobacter sp.]
MLVKCGLINDCALKIGNKPSLKACMLAYTFYETDGRVMRYAETLAKEGIIVEAIVLRRDNQSKEEIINGVKVLRIQRRVKNESGKYSYLARIVKFFFLSMIEITRRHLKAPYDIIHVHSVPDFEVFAAFVPKLKGAKIILDIHDIVPEFYAAKFNVSEKSLAFWVLKLIEKFSASFADHVIIANDLWLEKITARSITKDRCSSFINYPDLSVFNVNLKTVSLEGKFIMIYPGTLNWHQGLDIAVNAFAIAKKKAPNIELHIYGEGSAKAELQKKIADLQLTDKVFLRSPLPLREIASVMANADLGIVPKRNDSFGGDAFSTKILEFMALGVPVVVADTRIDKYYFNDSLVRFFKAGDIKDLAQVMLDAYHNHELNNQLASRALTFAYQHSWETKKGDYLALIEQLTQSSSSDSNANR